MLEEDPFPNPVVFKPLDLTLSWIVLHKVPFKLYILTTYFHFLFGRCFGEWDVLTHHVACHSDLYVTITAVATTQRTRNARVASFEVVRSNVPTRRMALHTLEVPTALLRRVSDISGPKNDVHLHVVLPLLLLHYCHVSIEK